MRLNQAFWEDTDKGVLIMRITLGVLILFHGWHKVVYGIEMPMTRLESFGIPGFFMYFAYISEVLAPALIVLGILTRLSAFTIFVTMTIVMYMELKVGIGFDQFGAPTSETQLFYWLFSAALMFTGAGRFVVPSPLTKKHWLLS